MSAGLARGANPYAAEVCPTLAGMREFLKRGNLDYSSDNNNENRSVYFYQMQTIPNDPNPQLVKLLTS
jgi:hypothetical protein